MDANEIVVHHLIKEAHYHAVASRAWRILL